MGQAAAPRSHLVLVVENQPLLRMMAVDMVEDAGFEAVEAADIDTAIAILETRLDIRLVFTDADMPHGLDGMKFAAMIRDRWPPIEIIITSSKRRLPERDLPLRAVFLPKPYRPLEVVALMKSMAANT